MSRLRTLKPGMLTLVEDGGRYGYGALGITQSGPADRYSAAWANRLLDNRPDAPVLEITMGGAAFEALGTIRIAITGAKVPLRINDRPIVPWCTHTLQRGDRLTIGMATEGLRIYLGTDGGWTCKAILDSCSVTLREGLGKRIETDTVLTARSFADDATPSRCAPPDARITFARLITLRMIRSYHYDRFDPLAREQFLAQRFRVSSATDRMGCRLTGEPIAYPGEILSEPTAYGAVQIPPDGQPIVLLNDRQTIGGYPIIGTVIAPDLFRLAQSRPGTQVRFEYLTLDAALEAVEAERFKA
jgi:biotin-dependent carboxylase-like uncharacterized protein